MLRGKFIVPNSITFAGLLFIIWRFLRYRNSVRYTFNRKSQITTPVAIKLQTLFPSYTPPFWLVSGLLQTISTEFIKMPSLSFRRDRIALPELQKPEGATCCPTVVPAGNVSIDWLDVDDDKAPIVVIVPGLTGSSEAGYVRRAADFLREKHGFRVACVNPRGRAGNVVQTPFLYSVGYTQDLKRIVEYIKQQYHETPIMAVGYSLGSNVLAKFVGEEGENSPLTAAVCLACPVDCLSISNSLGNTFVGRHVMDPILVNSVQNVRQELEHVLVDHPNIDLEQIKQARTMHEFDHATIAPMFEFETASDYYRHSSAGLHLSKIRRPVLFVHANNDPIIPGTMIKMDNFLTSPYLISIMTKEGGHSMDWPASDLSPWSARVIGEFLEGIIEQT